MDEQLTAAAKTLARWCYQRGVDEQILGCGPPLLRSAVDQALGRSTPPPSEDALWRRTAALLHQRRAWDREHQVSPPPPAECRFCAPSTAAGAQPTFFHDAAPAVASCSAASSGRASTPTRAATARAQARTPTSRSNPWRASCWAPLRYPTSRLSTESARNRIGCSDRPDPRSAHRRPRRTGTAGVGPRDPRGVRNE